MLSERGDKRRERDADDMNHYSHFIHLLIFRAASVDKKKKPSCCFYRSLFIKKRMSHWCQQCWELQSETPPPPPQHTQTYTHTSVNSTQPLLCPGNRHRHYSDYIAKGWIGRRTGGVDSNNVSNYLACKHEFMQRVRFCWCGSRRTAHQQARGHTEALPARVLRESGHT